MDRRTVESVGVALVGVFALALAAATLSSPVERRGGGGEGGSGGFNGSRPPLPEAPPAGDDGGIVALLLALVFVALLLLGLYAVVRRYRNRAVRVLALLAAIGLLALLVAALLGDVTPADLPSPGIEPGEPGAPGEDAPGPVTPVPPVLVVVLIVALIAGTAIALRLRTPGDEDEPEADEERSETAPVAEAAGDAADRIDEGGSVENEVYRAWREMTALLELSSPRTRTPGEFADAAVEAGMRAEDVAELTRLFEDVRYGDDDPTPGTERRAREVFRRIEATYGDDPA